MIISDLLKNRFDFRRDLRAGDEFDVVLKQGDVEGEPVGSEQVEAVRIKVRGQFYQAFLNADGREVKRLNYDISGNLDIQLKTADFYSKSKLPTIYQKYGILGLLPLWFLCFIFHLLLLKSRHEKNNLFIINNITVCFL